MNHIANLLASLGFYFVPVGGLGLIIFRISVETSRAACEQRIKLPTSPLVDKVTCPDVALFLVRYANEIFIVIGLLLLAYLGFSLILKNKSSTPT